MTVALRVENLVYRYPRSERDVIRGMSFEVRRGEIFGFLGPSGAGKTTTQRIVMGLVSGWSGQVQVLGRDLAEWGGDLYDQIGVSFELPVGHPRLTVREDLTFFAGLHGTPSRDIPDLVASVGLREAIDLPVRSLSKGMHNRLNLARSLVHGAELLFLDEPTAGLDPVNAARVRDVIEAERASGATVFLTTHDMVTASELCDRVAFVVDGRIAACDAPRSLALAHGRKVLRVEHRVDGQTQSEEFPLGSLPPELSTLLASEGIESIHSAEAGLDEVFASVTGHRL